jgi:hypothetical protein
MNTTNLSKYSKHKDIRLTYKNLPCQAFWTWVTGKSLRNKKPKAPSETLLKEWQLLLQVAWAYLVVISCVLFSSYIYNNPSAIDSGVIRGGIYLICMVLVTNRTRGLLHTMHYTSHGASIKNMTRAKIYSTYLMSIPILHTTWDRYRELHGRDHHAPKLLCTDRDPDQIFMIDHKFHKNMKESEFWIKVFFAPFHPMRIYKHLEFRFCENFLVENRKEVAIRSAYWLVFLAVTINSGYFTEVFLFFFIPLFFVTQISSWIQHLTEHLWFSDRPKDIPLLYYSSSLTWGRFQGRAYPIDDKGWKKVIKFSLWLAGTLFIDIPIRIFSFMQDLPSHDFHHRSTRVNFWRIHQERSANEKTVSKEFGPMAEAWGVVESVLILRDHLCYGESDPFGLLKGYRNSNRTDLNDNALLGQ